MMLNSKLLDTLSNDERGKVLYAVRKDVPDCQHRNGLMDIISFPFNKRGRFTVDGWFTVMNDIQWLDEYIASSMWYIYIWSPSIVLEISLAESRNIYTGYPLNHNVMSEFRNVPLKSAQNIPRVWIASRLPLLPATFFPCVDFFRQEGWWMGSVFSHSAHYSPERVRVSCSFLKRWVIKPSTLQLSLPVCQTKQPKTDSSMACTGYLIDTDLRRLFLEWEQTIPGIRWLFNI